MRNTRVSGHGLLSEGRPYVGDGICEVDGPMRRNTYDSFGVGVCSCGWRSETFWTTAERKRAFNQHKAEVTE